MQERPNEKAARHIVAEALGVSVRRFEDGSAPGQVDASFAYPNGRTAGLEVVADHEDAFNAQWSAIDRIGRKLTVPGLDGAWTAQLSRRAKVRGVAKHLPDLAVRWQHELGDSCPRPRRRDDTPEAIRRLGVRTLRRLEGSEQSGIIRLHTEGWGGVAGSGELAPFVERILSDHADVPAKLARHDADERHAFIWSTIGTDYGVQFALENREQPPPTEAPILPEGVTHVWVAGSFTSQGVYAWFPDRGWWRTTFMWPAEGLAFDDE